MTAFAVHWRPELEFHSTQTSSNAKVRSRRAQSSPGYLHVGQVPSNCTRQIPQTSSSGLFHRQVATAFHSLIVTFISLGTPAISAEFAARREPKVRAPPRYSWSSDCVQRFGHSSMSPTSHAWKHVMSSVYFDAELIIGTNLTCGAGGSLSIRTKSPSNENGSASRPIYSSSSKASILPHLSSHQHHRVGCGAIELNVQPLRLCPHSKANSCFSTFSMSMFSPTTFSKLSHSSSSRNRLSRGGLSKTQWRQITLQSYLVTPKELSEALKKNVPTKISTAPRIIPLCASWFLPNDPHARTGVQVYREQRIPTARFFDLDDVKDHDSQYPHMLPTAEDFAKAMQKLGIRKDDEIVVYDSKELGLFSAPRVAWTFKVFGHPSVHILNNFRLWVDEGFPTESGTPQEPETSRYPIPSVDPDKVVKFAEVKDIAKDHGKEGAEGIQILDARSRERWAGKAPEPRPGLAGGRIPGSLSCPATDLLHPETGALLPAEELRRIFQSKGVDPEKPVITSCGTGVTAAVVDAALGEAEFGPSEDRRIYDGSWT